MSLQLVELGLTDAAITARGDVVQPSEVLYKKAILDLHKLLVDLGHIVPIRPSDESYLAIRTPEVLALIQKDDPSWERMVPPKVAEIIKADRLFRQRA